MPEVPTRDDVVAMLRALYTPVAAAYVDHRMTLAQIAAETGMSINWVKNRLLEYGVTIRRQGPPKGSSHKAPASSRARVPVIVEMRRQGATLREIGAVVGVTYQRVGQIIRLVEKGKDIQCCSK